MKKQVPKKIEPLDHPTKPTEPGNHLNFTMNMKLLNRIWIWNIWWHEKRNQILTDEKHINIPSCMYASLLKFHQQNENN